MHLVSKKEQTVNIEEEQFKLEAGESIHTENSYKYSLDEFRKLVDNWFSVEQVWTDDQQLFLLQLLQKK
ncbi:L-histidine N(alpha)-methyltransferase [Fodinibius salsisoli]|uniref:L-histidine N(Alpha)-methyltransferase n=1 Tax=Fodinibius salsisoli TaxID=2820877 RepID=A0ABT3PS88_9BACT|nr:L-histidine N(alpha)-methyltransferase [Fodinibius salsisoli]MCW9708723.1 L-histidine N(alpha)-methyltransferase [Fodinibius salsisoli]